MKRTSLIIVTILGLVVFMQFACSKLDEEVREYADSEWLSGGQQTVFDEGSGAYTHMFSNLPENLEQVHEVGDVQFEATFVSAPSPVNPGLGPLFNNLFKGSFINYRND